MLSYLKKKYIKSKSLINYFFLTYLDKAISFALPLSILLLLKDKEQYAFVEVVFSYATLAVIIVELGVSNYLFYGYKHASDKEIFLLNASVNFKFLLSIYCFFLCVLFILGFFFDKNILPLIAFAGVRTLFNFYLNFQSNVFRLKDNPAKIYTTSVIVNIASFILLLCAGFFSWQHKIAYFFLPAFVLIVSIVLKFFIIEIRLFDFGVFKKFLIHALRFSWAIILNALAMSFMNNYAKIYAYGNLSEQEMIEVSYILRIGLIIQLTHSAFASYFSKSLFMESSNALNKKLLKQYSKVLLLSSFMVLLIIFATNYMFGTQVNIPLNVATLLFLLYIILWCYTGYLEIYFGIMNVNRKMLYYSLVSAAVYICLLKLCGDVGVFELSICMAITAILNLSLVIFGLQKLNVLNLKKTKTQNE